VVVWIGVGERDRGDGDVYSVRMSLVEGYIYMHGTRYSTCRFQLPIPHKYAPEGNLYASPLALPP
jgi:hypothetical protein